MTNPSNHPEDLPETCSKYRFAQIIGTSPSYVLKLVRKGQLVLTPEKQVVVRASLDALKRTADPSKYRTKASAPPEQHHEDDADDDPNNPSFAESRAERERYQAQIARLNYEERRENLIPREAIQRAWFRASRTARDKLLNMPDRLAPILAAEVDPVEVRRLLWDEINGALEALSIERPPRHSS